MQAVLTWVMANKALILGVLWGLSEALANIPAIKANSIFELVFGWLQKNKPAA